MPQWSESSVLEGSVLHPLMHAWVHHLLQSVNKTQGLTQQFKFKWAGESNKSPKYVTLEQVGGMPPPRKCLGSEIDSEESISIEFMVMG